MMEDNRKSFEKLRISSRSFIGSKNYLAETHESKILKEQFILESKLGAPSNRSRRGSVQSNSNVSRIQSVQNQRKEHQKTTKALKLKN
jgi:hypothetical protein